MKRTVFHLAAAVAPGAVAALLALPSGAAAADACPNPVTDAALKEQRSAMLCHVNELRRDRGLRPLRRSSSLDRAARLKASAIVRCESFSHTPCGRSFSATFAEAGYAVGNWTVGENIAWGSGERGSVATTFADLVASPTHFHNFVRAGWRDIGISLWRGNLFGHSGVAVWVIDFGSR
jgi:uncharacterized protein YkwD